ncbi:MAG: Helicase ATP-dependent domain protein [Cyanobacteria bacterium RYN_339]|nr:Helicase ATP-dependent domain protein [Cyanobacteria bacterium RYN_339]
MRPLLPVLAHADAIRAAVRDFGRLVLSAPPGTGKSTQVPQILWPASGTTIVLQPRRIAARSLAARVAAERGEKLGEGVGYQVRFEKARGADTRVLFQTYGVFWQQILQDPRLTGVSLVILDEFHERTLEADACLAWLRQVPDLAVVVMSATLDGSALEAYLGAPLLEIAAKAYPVEVSYLPPQLHERPWDQAARGFRHLVADGLTGSALVFMPGVGEIRRTADALSGFCRERGWTVLELSGAQGAEAQQQALSLPEQQPCVIVATNVAETSLTIPGVVAVIDSGLSRQAAYDAERDMDTLRLGWIAKANATQRAGRAGRLAPGRCLRLWPKGHESSMLEALAPEIERLDLTGLALAVASLAGEVSFLTPPPPDRWARAHARLAGLGALREGKITELGRKLLRYPLTPPLARVLLAAGPYASLVAAMIALVEAADRKEIADEGDLYLLGLDLAREAHRRRWHRDVLETYKQLLRLARAAEADLPVLGDADELARRRAVTEAWLTAYGDRLAFRQDKAYHLADGRKATPSAGSPASPLLVAIELHEVTGGPGGRQATIPLYLPCEAAWVGEGEPEIVSSWDATRQRVVQEKVWKAGGLTLRRETLPPDRWDKRQAEEMLAARLVAGEKVPAWDEDVDQLILRLRAADVLLAADDWEVIFHELAAGKSGVADIGKDAMVNVLREYVGWEATARVDREAPRTWKLPGGKPGKLTYFEDAPPELSARLGDMLGLEGTLALFDGRVPVLFDILAPNYRTVQKTFDMTGFWKNTYPEVKKELKRRYPKHPWP